MFTSRPGFPSSSSRIASALAFATASLGLNGCSTARYLLQATEGQLALLNHAKPIAEVVKDARTPTRIKELLLEVAPVKKFGEERGIKPTPNYTEYVRLDRAAAVWVVSACEPLEFKSREWKFPIVGSFPYLGWFDLEGAKEYAKAMSDEGLDADVRGAAAYSTLGWFRDAILSTMLPDGQEALGELVDVVIHESVHATAYVSGQAYFNESLASFVAEKLTTQYLAPRPDALRAYVEGNAKGEGRRKRLHDTYGQLKELYASARSKEEKVAEKKRILEALKSELGFRREINNATLIQYKTYHTGAPEFERLWSSCGGDSARFMKSVGTLKPESFPKGQQEDLAPVLGPLIQAGCRQT
jgi:predicted aminopeptidase